MGSLGVIRRLPKPSEANLPMAMSARTLSGIFWAHIPTSSHRNVFAMFLHGYEELFGVDWSIRDRTAARSHPLVSQPLRRSCTKGLNSGTQSR